MKFESKFNLKDTVYPISLRKEEKWIPCKSCEAKGFIKLADGEITDCPKCYGHTGRKEYKPTKWLVDSELVGKIGRIQVTKYSNKNCGKDEITYMLSSTGVGSGSLWQEDILFLSREEAQEECDRRNKEE